MMEGEGEGQVSRRGYQVKKRGKNHGNGHRGGHNGKNLAL